MSKIKIKKQNEGQVLGIFLYQFIFIFLRLRLFIRRFISLFIQWFHLRSNLGLYLSYFILFYFIFIKIGHLKGEIPYQNTNFNKKVTLQRYLPLKHHSFFKNSFLF